jgi:hypothetical protein
VIVVKSKLHALLVFWVKLVINMKKKNKIQISPNSSYSSWSVWVSSKLQTGYCKLLLRKMNCACYLRFNSYRYFPSFWHTLISGSICSVICVEILPASPTRKSVYAVHLVETNEMEWSRKLRIGCLCNDDIRYVCGIMKEVYSLRCFVEADMISQRRNTVSLIWTTVAKSVCKVTQPIR